MPYTYITSKTSPNQTPAGSVKRFFGRARTVDSITIHHWGAFGQSFDAVANYLCRVGGKSSAHYVVEDGKVACLVAPAHAAWHSGSSKGNATSVGIECRPEATDGDYATVAELIRELRAVYGDIPLVPHSSWKATACPGKWDLARLDRLARSGAAAAPAPAAPAPAPKPAPAPAPAPQVDPRIMAVQARLNRDYPLYSNLKVDGIDGPRTKAVVREFQRRAGLYVDGIAGPKTLRKLGLG